jgi:hypothetical protein
VSEQNWLKEDFDCVVMLTWSDWRTEPRSNRYHFATRFAKQLPVYFVQMTRPGLGQSLTEAVADHDITLVHLGWDYGAAQSRRLLDVLDGRGHTKPLYWIYNPRYMDICRRRPSTLKVYHATEDYLGRHKDVTFVDEPLIREFMAMLQNVDLVVAVTESVASNTQANGNYTGEMLVLKNGCDAEHWISATADAPRSDSKTAIFQGGINARLDYPMIEQIVTAMPDWKFWFCGNTTHAMQPQWNSICAKPNVRSFGQIHPDMIAKLQSRATVGVIPFQQNSFMQISLPLKAYEYVASGLPVVTTPIFELEKEPELFVTATNATEFVAAIRASAATRWSPEHLERRLAAARSVSYNNRFEALLNTAARIHLENKRKQESARDRRRAIAKDAAPDISVSRAPPRKRVLVAYSASGIHVQTTADYLGSLKRYIDGEVEFIHVTNRAKLNVDLNRYDAVFQNYCARWPYVGYVCEDFAEKLANFAGPKILAVQDEYDRTAILLDAIERVGFDIVLTCVPPDQIERVYPRARYPFTKFKQVLTGYVPENLDQISSFAMPLRQRPNVIGYRGRDIGPKYGRLGFDKLEIGRRLRAACDARGLASDINWTEDSRIYGRNWFRFMGSCRATLGTESGSNVFDFDESVERLYVQLTEQNGRAPTYEEFLPLIQEKDAAMDMGQISPKFFEAAALKTPMVLLRGRYSDMLEPHTHYIPLERDYSNVDEVLNSLQDFEMLEAMADRTFDHLVGSGKFSYESFVQTLDEMIDIAIADLQASPRPPLSVPFTRREEPAIAEEDLPLLLERPIPEPCHPLHYKNNEGRLTANTYLRHIKYLESVYPPEIDRLNRIIVEEQQRWQGILSSETQRITGTYEEQIRSLNAEVAKLQAAQQRHRVDA